MSIQEQPSGLIWRDTNTVQMVPTNPVVVVHHNGGASLVDLGDGTLCLKFHTKANTLDMQVFELIELAGNELAKDWSGLVIGNEGIHFSAGANLGLFADCIERRAWGEMEHLLIRLQKGFDVFRYSNKPVVTAPFGMTLGGGCEVVMASSGICAAMDARMGQIEARVGLVPTLGGCLEPLRRLAVADIEPMEALKSLFMTITLAKISTDAEDARSLGFLMPTDWVIPDRADLIAKAKTMVRTLKNRIEDDVQAKYPVWVTGRAGLQLLEDCILSLKEQGLLAGHACHVAGKLAVILSGGGVGPGHWAEPQSVLDLEREAFMSLLSHPLSAERIMHSLKTGTVLHN